MNYQKIYNSLIEKAQTRQSTEYTETHHVIPKCKGGSDDDTNLARLTPEEHFLAHLLLVKIATAANEPKHIIAKLASAVNIMCAGRDMTNKSFGYARRVYASNHPSKQPEGKAAIREGMRQSNKKPQKRVCPILICPHCLTLVSPALPTRRFCSTDCRTKHRAGSGYLEKLSAAHKNRFAAMNDNERKAHVARSCLSMTEEAKENRAKKISSTKAKEAETVKSLTDAEFYAIVSKMQLHRSDGARNGNLVRLLRYKGIDVEEYYNSRVQGT